MSTLVASSKSSPTTRREPAERDDLEAVGANNPELELQVAVTETVETSDVIRTFYYALLQFSKPIIVMSEEKIDNLVTEAPKAPGSPFLPPISTTYASFATNEPPMEKPLAPGHHIKEKESLTNFIAVMEGRATTDERLTVRRKSIGRLMVDQTLPLPRVMDIRTIILKDSVPGDTTAAASMERNRNKAVFEILESEIAYIEALDLMMELLVYPLRRCTEADDGVEIISKEDIDTIFSDMEAIRGINSQLANELAQRFEDWSHVQMFADIFIELAPFFRSYNRYVDHYSRALARAKELESSNYAFRSLLSDFKNNPKAKKLDLYAFLIKPIQRIPKYSLLLENVVKYTPPQHPDLENIRTAITKIKAVADYVNKAAAEGESRAKVMEIQTRFLRVGSQNIVEPARKFVKEGVMFKFSLTNGGSVQKRVVYLFSDLFLTVVPLIGAQKQDKFIPLVSACVVDQPVGPYPHMYFLVSPVKTLILICETKEDKSAWMAETNKAIADLISNNPTLASEREKYDLVTDDRGMPRMVLRTNLTTTGSFVLSGPTPAIKLKSVVSTTVEGILGLMQFKPVANKVLDFSYSPITGHLAASAISAEPQRELEDDMDGFELVEVRKPQDTADKKGRLLSSSEVIANLLRNKGQIKTTPDVVECSGQVLWNEDKRHEATYPIESSYLVFPESYRSFLTGLYIGCIELVNRGTSPILLVSHLRKVQPDRMTYFKLQPGETKTFDFKGLWCIEVRNGDCSSLMVTEYSNQRGTGHDNDLGMVL